jgi:hypothetical protein
MKKKREKEIIELMKSAKVKQKRNRLILAVDNTIAMQKYYLTVKEEILNFVD